MDGAASEDWFSTLHYQLDSFQVSAKVESLVDPKS
jgi:hypothetical protein